MFLYLNVTKMQQIGLCLDDALDSILEPILQRFFSIFSEVIMKHN